jgi:hypothetical protein
MVFKLRDHLVHLVVGESTRVSKSFRTGRLERELQMVQLSLSLLIVVSLFCVSV